MLSKLFYHQSKSHKSSQLTSLLSGRDKSRHGLLCVFPHDITHGTVHNVIIKQNFSFDESPILDIHSNPFISLNHACDSFVGEKLGFFRRIMVQSFDNMLPFENHEAITVAEMVISKAESQKHSIGFK